MARILSIDYGKRRTGIAVTDPLQIIANGLATVSTPQLYQFLVDYMAKEPVERIVIGSRCSRTDGQARILPVWSSLSRGGEKTVRTFQ